MAWGFFNKIKKGFKKAGSFIRKAANFVNDKVMKPFKPINKTAINTFVPGAGAIVDMTSDGIDAITKNDWGAAKESAENIGSWAKSRFG